MKDVRTIMCAISSVAMRIMQEKGQKCSVVRKASLHRLLQCLSAGICPTWIPFDLWHPAVIRYICFGAMGGVL